LLFEITTRVARDAANNQPIKTAQAGRQRSR